MAAGAEAKIARDYSIYACRSNATSAEGFEASAKLWLPCIGKPECFQTAVSEFMGYWAVPYGFLF